MQPPPGAITNSINHEEAICEQTLLNARKADRREKRRMDQVLLVGWLVGFNGLRLRLPNLVFPAEI